MPGMANRKDNKYQVSHSCKFLHAKCVLWVNHSFIDTSESACVLWSLESNRIRANLNDTFGQLEFSPKAPY